jgi:hypothetical protein
MSIFIPVLYICMNGHCEFLQQLTHYTDRQQCMAIVQEKKQEFIKMGATVDVTCIDLIVQKRGLYES